MFRSGLIAAMVLLAGCGQQREGAPPRQSETAAPTSGQSNGLSLDAPTLPAPTENKSAEVDAAAANPCLMQGDVRITAGPLGAVGTEPFWAARVEGRCVTYSTPDDQQGVRVWTRYEEGPNGTRSWTGQLDGKPFAMVSRPEPGCSDGMSDKRYPLAVELSVDGEHRKGCGRPL